VPSGGTSTWSFRRPAATRSPWLRPTGCRSPRWSPASWQRASCAPPSSSRAATVRLDDAALLADPALAAADAALDSVLNVNASGDYAAARERPAPEITVQRHGSLASDGHHGPRVARAATLVGAATAAGLELDPHVIVALNGDRISRDGEVPLVAGDTVAFRSSRCR